MRRRSGVGRLDPPAVWLGSATCVARCPASLAGKPEVLVADCLLPPSELYGSSTRRLETLVTKDAGIARYIAGSSYPTTIAAAFALFAAATGTGVPVTLAAYGAVLAGAALVALHEAVLPYRAQWRPGPAEVRADLLFMAAVQVALPYLFVDHAGSCAGSVAARCQLGRGRHLAASLACGGAGLPDAVAGGICRATGCIAHSTRCLPCGGSTPCIIRRRACIG